MLIYTIELVRINEFLTPLNVSAPSNSTRSFIQACESCGVITNGKFSISSNSNYTIVLYIDL